MTSQIPEESTPVIAVFFAGNSLMHQVSNWAIRHPEYDFALSFAQSLDEIREILRRTAVAIVDASEDPARAMAAFTRAIDAMEADRVAVYTETIHEGLELFVRVRGAPLLLGPMGDEPWNELLQKMLQSAARIGSFGVLTQRRGELYGGLPKTWLRKYRLHESLAKRLPNFFHEKR